MGSIVLRLLDGYLVSVSVAGYVVCRFGVGLMLGLCYLGYLGFRMRVLGLILATLGLGSSVLG